jgi:hypothetical protein
MHSHSNPCFLQKVSHVRQRIGRRIGRRHRLPPQQEGVGQHAFAGGSQREELAYKWHNLERRRNGQQGFRDFTIVVASKDGQKLDFDHKIWRRKNVTIKDIRG